MFGKKKQPVLIKHELENDTLFWRHPVEQLEQNSRILVRATDQMVFEKNGKLLDILDSGDYPIYDKTSKFFGLFPANLPQSVEMIYMSKTAKLQVLWGTPNYFDFIDPLTETPVQVGASGEFEVQISNPKKFYLELVGRDRSFDLESLKRRLQGRLLSFIEPEISQFMIHNQTSYNTIVMHKPQISNRILAKVSEIFEEEYGLKVFSFTLSRIFLSEESKLKLDNELERRKANQEVKEIITEVQERTDYVDDREFEKEITRRKMDQEDYKEYIGAVKEVGFETQNTGTRVEKKFCHKCGAEVQFDALFCSKCGAKLS